MSSAPKSLPEGEEVVHLAFAMPGVIQMPLNELEQRMDELPRDCLLILACAGGQRSLKATCF